MSAKARGRLGHLSPDRLDRMTKLARLSGADGPTSYPVGQTLLAMCSTATLNARSSGSCCVVIGPVSLVGSGARPGVLVKFVAVAVDDLDQVTLLRFVGGVAVFSPIDGIAQVDECGVSAPVDDDGEIALALPLEGLLGYLSSPPLSAAEARGRWLLTRYSYPLWGALTNTLLHPSHAINAHVTSKPQCCL